MENNVKKYSIGTKWKSNNFGNFEIINKSNRRDKSGRLRFYICKFEDGTIVEATSDNINKGEVKNPNYPNVCGVGFLSQGKYIAFANGKATKEYGLWLHLIRRCYSENFPSYKYYGGKGIVVDKRWHNFQNFCEDIQELEHYEEWNNFKGWELDKDIKQVNVENKIYSKDTCKFVLGKDNKSEMATRTMEKRLVGFDIVGERLSDGYMETFINITHFSNKWDLCLSCVCQCLKNGKTHKGWKFYKKQEAIDLVKSKYGVDVNEDIAEAILLSEFNEFE